MGNYFTVVYKDIAPGDEARALGEHPKMSAASWSHALRERDFLDRRLNMLMVKRECGNSDMVSVDRRVIERAVEALREAANVLSWGGIKSAQQELEAIISQAECGHGQLPGQCGFCEDEGKASSSASSDDSSTQEPRVQSVSARPIQSASRQCLNGDSVCASSTIDVSIGAYQCTECGAVGFYTESWRKFYENGVPCIGSDFVSPADFKRLRAAISAFNSKEGKS